MSTRNALERNDCARRRRPTRLAHRRGNVTVEAAFCLPILVTLMLGMWQVGRMVQVTQILTNGAREGARYAALGNLNINGVNTPITVAMVQTTVSNYLTAAGLPSAAVSGAQIQVTNLSTDTWTDPSGAQPGDQFKVTVTIPSGAAFNSLQWCALNFTGTNQLSASATWVSLVDSQITVSTTLPY